VPAWDRASGSKKWGGNDGLAIPALVTYARPYCPGLSSQLVTVQFTSVAKLTTLAPGN
jgi:hypothetical protein